MATYPVSRTALAVHSLHSVFRSFPVACFTLTLATDIAYWRTSNLLWLHFSEWLLLAGLVFGVIALPVHVADILASGRRMPWLVLIGSIVVLLLATVNSFVHTADGWTAVVPYGLVLSAVTVLAMIVTGCLSLRERYHV